MTIRRVTAEQYRDIQLIARWLQAHVPGCKTATQAESWACHIVLAPDYDRTRPTPDNRFSGHAFEIPAVTTLEIQAQTQATEAGQTAQTHEEDSHD